MSTATPNPQVREALGELHQYLSDILPPLVVADSIKLLLRQPPELLASQIQGWSTAQYRVSGEIPFSDYLYHAVKKIHLMGVFRLVPKGPFQGHFAKVKELVVSCCPEEDREFLKTNLAGLGETAALSSSVDVLLRPGQTDASRSSGRPSASVARARAAEEMVGLRRVGLLLERLERLSAAGGSTRVPAEMLAAAARSSQSVGHLEEFLERLREMGMEVETRDVFRSLSSSLPGWMSPVSAEALPSSAPAPGGSAVQAMHRMVTEAEDPAETGTRFMEMVKTAIERFNEGALTQSATMLELAQRIINEGRVDKVSSDVVRQKTDEDLDSERLRQYAEAPDRHVLLRKVLNFFAGLTPVGLFGELRKELKRERRRLLLLLLEVHGPPAREAALEKLRVPFGQGVGDEDWYFRRNLLYVLRRVPRPVGVPLEEDVEIAVRHAELRFPVPLVKEAIGNLGQLKHEKAERRLVQLLDEIEASLSKPESGRSASDMQVLLDRVAAALARFGTPGARRAIVEHGLKTNRELGDTMARLAELSGQDLSADPEIVERLLAALKSNAPFKLFGLVLAQNDRNLYHCIEALSGTPLPAVRQAFEDIVQRFAGKDVARVASKALEGSFHSPPAAAESSPGSLTGDLELFGLPALIQSLADAGMSGLVTLRDPKGEAFGTISLRKGRLKNCQTGRLLGDDAFFQLIERPRPGSFVFVKLPDVPADEISSSARLREVLSLILEGMRRYDELQQFAAVAPDDSRLGATAVKPTPHMDEQDGILVKDLWTRVAPGARPVDCESDLAVDSYRIRRLLAHWVESGALELRE